MRSFSLLACLILASTLLSCGGVRGSTDWRVGACGRHDQCSGNAACVLGQCVGGRLDEEMDVAAINASQWFDREGGQCDYDDECGPWMCGNGECVVPADAHRPMLARREYRYWDTSCHAAEDCGPWECAGGWCTQPGFASAQLHPSTATIDGTLGASCLGDNECESGADCVFPGYCRGGAAEELMTFVDIAGADWYSNDDGSCHDDGDCGPHVCQAGWCVAQEFADRPRQLRSAYFYYDASCSTVDECGAWSCVDGWCRDPVYLP